MNYLTRLIGLCLLLLTSCNRYIDVQPTPDNGPPTSTVRTLIERYPQAQEVEFATLVPNQFWRATFTYQRHRYQALTNPAQLLTTDQLVEGTIADSLTRLLEPTVIAGGTFSNPRFRQFELNRAVISPNGRFIDTYADYTWQQQAYTLHWSIAWPLTGKPFYNLYLLPVQMTRYTTDQLTDLPESIQTSLRQQSMVFAEAQIEMESSGKRRYLLFIQQPSRPPAEQYWQLSYDEEGRLLAAINSATAQYFQQLDRLPTAVQQYLQRPEMAGFGLGTKGGQFGSFARHDFGSLTTYAVNVEKGKQAWQLLFSGEGQLICRSFLLYGSF